MFHHAARAQHVRKSQSHSHTGPSQEQSNNEQASHQEQSGIPGAGDDANLQRLANNELFKRAKRHIEHERRKPAEEKKKRRQELQKRLGLKKGKIESEPYNEVYEPKLGRKRRSSGKIRTGPNRDPGPRLEIEEPSLEIDEDKPRRNSESGSNEKKIKRKRSSEKGSDRSLDGKQKKRSRGSPELKEDLKQFRGSREDKSEEKRKRRGSREERVRRRSKDFNDTIPMEKDTGKGLEKVMIKKENKVAPTGSAMAAVGNPPTDDLPKKEEESGSNRRPNRCDAVVFMVLFAMMLGCITCGFETYALAVDKNWNGVLYGEKPIKDYSVHGLFNGTTLDLSTHMHLKQARDYAWRYLASEYTFVVIHILIIAAAACHIFMFYLLENDFDTHAKQLIIFYIASGAVSIFISVLPVSSAISIENSYTYAADMLFNFQHMFDHNHEVQNEAECAKDVYQKGCESYEFAKKSANTVEQIFRLCGGGSRYTRYYRTSNRSSKAVNVLGELYFRHELKHMGFCSPDGYKYVAAIFSIITGVLFSIVPIVFCCEATSSKKNSYYDELQEGGSPSGMLMGMQTFPPPTPNPQPEPVICPHSEVCVDQD